MIANPYEQAPKSGTPYVKRRIQTFQDNKYLKIKLADGGR
jgi:hypothetical protein